MHTSRRLLPTVVLLATLAVVLPACQRAQDAAAEAALERATGTEMDIKDDGKQVTIKTDQGDLRIAAADAGDSVALPADFPADVYLPRQHRVASVMDMAGLKMVNLTSTSTLQALSAEVEKSMQAGGWKREMAMQAEGSASLMYSKDKRQAVYQLLKGDDGTQVAIRTGLGD